MEIFEIFLWMLFCHFLADFPLQGVLATMKQRDWWRAQSAYSDKYKNDYIVSLIIHSFSWTFMIMLPIYLANNRCITPLFLILFVANVIIHSIVDNEKANKGSINLEVDQLVHVWQIVGTLIICWTWR